MKLLYYSTSIQASHGGSIQAIEFFDHLDQLSIVKEKQLFPQNLKPAALGKPSDHPLKKLLKRSSLLQILFFFRRNKFYLKELEVFIKRNTPDAVILQIDSNFLQIKKLKHKFPGLLICTQVNGSPFDEPFRNIAFLKVFLRKQRKAYACADLNFFISHFLRNRIMGAEMEPDRDKVVQNGTDVIKFRPLDNKKGLRSRLGYSEEAYLAGYVGTLDEHKKMELLLDVFEKLFPKYPKLELVIIGAGSTLPILREQVKNRGLVSKIHFRNWINHHEINQHLNCFDVAVHHYANDYMSPLKIFEYLAAGIPVIGPDIPSVREVFTNGNQLLLTAPEIEAIQRNLIDVIEHPEQAKERAFRGREFVADNFTWARYTEKIVTAIAKKKDQQL